MKLTKIAASRSSTRISFKTQTVDASHRVLFLTYIFINPEKNMWVSIGSLAVRLLQFYVALRVVDKHFFSIKLPAKTHWHVD